MPFPVNLAQTFSAQLADAASADVPRAQVGMWISSGSEVAAEIVASAGFDWVLIDGEHSPYSLETITSLLRAVGAYDATPVVRLPVNDTVLIKQYLDLGVQNLMVPMVDTAKEAEAAVAAMHYPPRGVRGVGAALARSSRWNAVPDYLNTASDTISLTVQIESAEAVKNAEEILAVDGVDAVFIGPSDLAASMGLIGQQQHPDVLDAVNSTIQKAKDAGKFVGVNAFNLDQAQAYLDAGVDFALVAADVSLLANHSRALAERFCAE